MPNSRNLASLPILKKICREHNIKPTQSSGQHFLVCEEPLETTVAALADGPKLITELGAGLGTLTERLLTAGHTVRAIERDGRLLPILAQAGTADQLTIVEADLRYVSWHGPAAYQLTGNIPYNLSGYILRHLTQMTLPPTKAVFLLQDEVAERLIATPPQMNLLAVAVQLWGKTERLAKVTPACFWPPPKVNSALIAITAHNNLLPLPEREKIISLAKLAFQTKRKQLGTSLSQQLSLSKQAIESALISIGSNARERPQELSLEQWQQLASILPQRLDRW